MTKGANLVPGQRVALAEVLRLLGQYSDNAAANVLIDALDRKRVTALLEAMGCYGSEVTRKFLPRKREDAEYQTVRGTSSCALHFAQFLWAVETGAIGGGRGRGLIKGFLAIGEPSERPTYGGLLSSATVYSKNGDWGTYSSEAGIIECGSVRWIQCVLTALQYDIAVGRIAAFTRQVLRELTI